MSEQNPSSTLELLALHGVPAPKRRSFTLGGFLMRAYLFICLGLATGLTFPLPSHAEYRLNCKLMDHHSPNFKRWCLGDEEQPPYVIRQCSTQGLCIVRAQNFGSAFLKNDATGFSTPVKSTGAVGSAALSAAAGNTASGVTNSVKGVTTEAKGLVGHTLSTAGFEASPLSALR
jgi:hypothetical protein